MAVCYVTSSGRYNIWFDNLECVESLIEWGAGPQGADIRTGQADLDPGDTVITTHTPPLKWEIA